MSNKTINIAAINGSLRKKSINGKFLKALISLAPDGVNVNIINISKLPLYNSDFDTNYPKVALDFKADIAANDAVLFVNPEHNRSFTAAMKNAIDWGNHPYGQNVWDGMPAAVTGASGGAIGTFGAQNHLRQVLVMVGVNAMTAPQLYFQTGDHMSDEGEIIDDGTLAIINEFWEAFVIWINRFKD